MGRAIAVKTAYRKNDRWPSYRFYSALQRQKSPMRYICEISEAPQFSSFSTQSVQHRKSWADRQNDANDPNSECARQAGKE